MTPVKNLPRNHFEGLLKKNSHYELTFLFFKKRFNLFFYIFQAYDNVESSVRKASVFCMVALHQLVGDQLQPHLSSLNGSKLKLLNLYIKRAEAQSTPASPRLTPPWFSFWMKNSEIIIWQNTCNPPAQNVRGSCVTSKK